MNAHNQEMAADHHGLAHVLPLKIMFGVFFALVAFTALTVALAQVDALGKWDIVIAMAIATIKGLLVALYFMHLRYDKVLNILFFFVSILFVAIFVGFALLDVGQYQENLERNVDRSAIDRGLAGH